jgi:hypothetical protein
MKYSKNLSFILIIFFLSTSILFAEYYSFIDSNGIKHYTDNILEVPVDQRPNLNIYTSIQSPQKENSIQEPEDKKENSSNHESLLIIQEELKLEHDTLFGKREELEKQKQSLDNNAYNELVIQLNIEIEKYQDKLLNYETRVEQYNAQLDKPDTPE